MSLTHTPLGLMDDKRSTRKKKKEAKQCTLITAALHFSAFYLSRGIDFMASITFNGVELWKEPWNDTEAAVRRNPKGFPLTFLFFSLPLFLHHSFFSCPWGQNANSLRGVFGILLASVNLLCYRSWILSIYLHGVPLWIWFTWQEWLYACLCMCVHTLMH